MAKKVTGYIKLQIPAGKATPAPPVGPALGQHGVNIVQFTKEFNARTADKGDLIIPVVITVYADRSFSFITKTPPAAVLLKKACNLKSGSGVPNKTKVATISKDKIREIAEIFEVAGIDTEIIAASVRNPIHVTDCALAGADIATVPYKVIEQMTHHPLTDAGIEKFQADYKAVFGE